MDELLEAYEAVDTALAEREKARANPHWALPIGDPRRRRAQQRFDAAVEACRQASLAYDDARRALKITPTPQPSPHARQG